MKITPSHANGLNFKLKTSVLGGLLLCAALSSSALTVGRMRGAAWLGQPLDVSIQVQYDAAENLSALCFDAEVFHADTRQDAARVRVSVESSSQPNTAQVRVQSAVAVDEPVVSVYLRESCVSKSSRRYVLLSEIPGTIVPSGTLTTAPPAPSGATAAPATPTSAPAATALRPAPSVSPPPAKPAPAPRPQPQPAVTKPVEPDQSKPGTKAVPRKQELAVAIKPKAAAEPAGKPQLKLDPLSSLNERVAQLEDITLAAHTADGDREAQRLKKMEDSVASLLALAAKNERGMTELRQRLEQAESEKYDNPLVYGLAALLLSALGAVAYFWRRQQQLASASDWWRGEPEDGGRMPVPPGPPSPAPQEVPVAAPTVAPVAMATAASLTPVAPAVEVVQSEPQTGSRPVADIDLDDLMAPSVGSLDSEAFAQSFPELPSALPADAKATTLAQEVVATEVESPAAYVFPAAGEVTIDISHLSLSPVSAPPAAESAPEALLDFDFPDFERTDTPDKGEDSPKPPADSGPSR